MFHLDRSLIHTIFYFLFLLALLPRQETYRRSKNFHRYVDDQITRVQEKKHLFEFHISLEHVAVLDEKEGKHTKLNWWFVHKA